MATKDISDLEVCQCQYEAWITGMKHFGIEILQGKTGQPKRVCYRALERAASRGLVEYGTSLRSGWLTEAGLELLETEETTNG